MPTERRFEEEIVSLLTISFIHNIQLKFRWIDGVNLKGGEWHLETHVGKDRYIQSQG